MKLSATQQPVVWAVTWGAVTKSYNSLCLRQKVTNRRLCWPSAACRRGQASTTPSSPYRPGVDRVYKGRTQTVLQSPLQSHQRRNSGLWAVMFRRSGLDEQNARGSTGWYEGLHITLYGASPVQGGDGTTEYEEETLVQSMTGLTEMDLRRDSSWDTSRQNISQSLCVARNLDTCQYKCDSLWDTTNNGTKRKSWDQ